MTTDNRPLIWAKLFSSNSKTVTDNAGGFSIAGDSKSLSELKCRVEAKGKQFFITVPLMENQNAPIIIHLDPIGV